jgi:prepilin signal peptidase PulO-like enzyme (type II secretory pathway)
MLGGFFGSLLPTTPPPLILQALGGSLLGYLVGGGLVWAIRIVGTLAFGREAMGMGDVHLLAAVGAVLGWFDPILVFFIAPFSGLLWTATAGILRVKHRELPYGPHLAAATVLVILGRPGLVRAWDIWMPMPFPEGGRQVEPAEIPQSAPPFAPSQARREVEGIGCLWIS